MAILTQYPYIDEHGVENNSLVKFYSNENCKLIKLETGEEYEEVIDLYPSRFEYVEKEKNDNMQDNHNLN